MPTGIYKRTKPSGMKGKHHTEEAKKKLSKALKGRIFSESHKKKIGLANRNREHPPLTEEHKKHISESLKGRILSDEWKSKMSQSRLNRKEILGYLNSPETRKKISEANMGHIPWNKGKSGEYKMKLNKPRLGVRRGPPSEETKRKIGLGNKGKILSEETKNKMRKARLGKKSSPETKRKLSIIHSGEKHWNWQGGKSLLTKRIRRSFKYRQWRSDVFTRDDFTCQECDKRGVYLYAHHIKTFIDILELNDVKTFDQAMKCEELWNINNGITLCLKCHDLTRKRRP